MDLGASTERLMGMSEAAWLRHANPWSGWTRMATTPLLFLAIWSHVWIGWWALLPVGVLAVWLWLNPRVFPPPDDTDNWMSRGVLGERVWLNRRAVPIPASFETAGRLLTGGSLVGAAIAAYGFLVADLWAALGGFTLMAVFKAWFVDRMVWLHEVMQDAEPRHAGRLRPRSGSGPAAGASGEAGARDD